jgi:hypothetical protein
VRRKDDVISCHNLVIGFMSHSSFNATFVLFFHGDLEKVVL